MLSPRRLQEEHRAQVNRVHLGIVEVWPTLAIAAEPVSSAVANTVGAYVEAIPINTITVPFSVVGLIVAPPDNNASFTGVVYDIGIDTGGGDVSAGEVLGITTFHQSDSGYTTSIQIHLSDPIEVPANAQVVVRVRDSLASTQTHKVYVQTQREDGLVVLPNLITGRTTQIGTIAPATGGFPTVTSGAGPFTLGAWVQLIASTSVDAVLWGASFTPVNMFNEDNDAQLQIGTGGGGSEVRQAEFAYMINSRTSNLGNQQGDVMTLPRPFFIPAGTRISARTAVETASHTSEIAAMLIPIPFR